MSPAAPPAGAVAAVPNARAPGFVEHVHDAEFRVSAPRDAVWAWLESPATFADNQVWPWRVEFLSPEPDVEPGFTEGGINVHHGPGLCAAGCLTEIREGEYRDLQYFYGSHVLAFRLVRPTRLEFWVEDAPAGGTRVQLRLRAYVRSWFAGVWSLASRVFWARFPRFLARSLDARIL